MKDVGYRIRLQTDVIKFRLEGIPNHPGMAARIFDHLHQAGINVELVVHSASGGPQTDLSLVVREIDAEQTLQQLEALRDLTVNARIHQDRDTALITLEKEDLSKTHGAAARMFKALADLAINIDLISTSLDSITCLIAEESADAAYRALLCEFADSDPS